MNTSVRLLRTAGAVAALGNGATGVILPVALAQNLGGISVGVSLGALSVGMMLSFAHGGAAADSQNRSKIMRRSDWTRALANISIAIGLLVAGSTAGAVGVLAIYLGCFANGLMVGYFRPAQASMWSTLLPKDELEAELKINSLINRFFLAVGGAVGGLFVAMGVPVVGIVFDAVTFAVTGLLAHYVHDPRESAPAQPTVQLRAKVYARLRMDRQWSDIISLTGRSSWMRLWFICAVNASWMVAIISVAGPIVLVQKFTDVQIGVFQSVGVVSLLLGAVVAWRIPRTPFAGILDAWGGVGSALSYLALATGAGFVVSTALRSSSYFAQSLAGPSVNAYVGRNFPPDERGRIFAATTGASSVLAPVGMLIGGVLVTVVSAPIVLYGAALLSAVTVSLPLVRRSYWTLSV